MQKEKRRHVNKQRTICKWNLKKIKEKNLKISLGQILI